VAHDPSAVDGNNSAVDPRIGVLQLDTGIITRLPIPAIGGLNGCFLVGRTNVLAVYEDVAGVSGLGLIDLATGAFTGIELDSETLFIGPPVMSPDSKTAALLCRRENADSVLQFQLHMLDLGKRTLTPIGKPGSLGAPYSWLPDGKGIVMKRFLPADMDAVQPRMLCVMRLDGTLTDIGIGDMPLVVPHQRMILHEGDNREWYLSDLTGKKLRKYSNGMKGYGGPAISPDGKEVLWLQFSSDELPKLWLFPFESDRGKPVKIGEGFAGHPVW
jgi:Tol biopolymer transport system component